MEFSKIFCKIRILVYDKSFLTKRFRHLPLRSFLIGRLIFIGQKFWRKKNDETPKRSLSFAREGNIDKSFGNGGGRVCTPTTPVYHTYFYTKYFNNATCKSRSSPFGRAIDRSYPMYESSSLVIIFSFLTIGSSAVIATIELYTIDFLTSQPLIDHF